MKLSELKEQAIINQMAYYASIYAQECFKNEYLCYDFEDNTVTFDNEIDIKRHDYYKRKVFAIPISDLIGCGGLIEIYDYADNKKEPNLQVKDIDAIINIIKWKYRK
jgi:hypothetical protein